MRYRSTLVRDLPGLSSFFAGAAYLVLLVSLSSCDRASLPRTSETIKGEVLATVNGESITIEEYESELNFSALPYRSSSAEEIGDLKQALFEQFIDRKLLVQEVKRRGIKVTPLEWKDQVRAVAGNFSPEELNRFLSGAGMDTAEWRAHLYEEIQIKKLLDEEFSRIQPATLAEQKEYYEKNLLEFREPAKIHIRHILVATERQARVLLTVLKSGLEFSVLAEKKSLAPERSRGGDWGFCSETEIPTEFRKRVFRLALGEVSPPVKSAYGWHLFFAEAKRKARVSSLETSKSRISELIMAKKKDQAFKSKLAELRKRATLEVRAKL